MLFILRITLALYLWLTNHLGLKICVKWGNYYTYKICTGWPDSIATCSDGKKSLPFLHREFEIIDMSLQLWTEFLNLSDTDVLPQVSFGQEQLPVDACCRKRFTGVTKGIRDFWCSTHIPDLVLVVPEWLAPAFIAPRRTSAQQRGSPGQLVCSTPKPDLHGGPLCFSALSRRGGPSEQTPIAWDKSQGVTAQAGHGQC